MIWEKEFKIKVAVSVKDQGEQSLIETALQLLENQIRNTKLISPGSVLRVTNVRKLATHSSESFKNRIRTFIERVG